MRISSVQLLMYIPKQTNEPDTGHTKTMVVNGLLAAAITRGVMTNPDNYLQKIDYFPALDVLMSAPVGKQ